MITNSSEDCSDAPSASFSTPSSKRCVSLIANTSDQSSTNKKLCNREISKTEDDEPLTESEKAEDDVKVVSSDGKDLPIGECGNFSGVAFKPKDCTKVKQERYKDG